MGSQDAVDKAFEVGRRSGVGTWGLHDFGGDCRDIVRSGWSSS
jgi:hypothetical protein